MELGKLTIVHQITKVSGWISVIIGLIVLFIFNIGLVTNYSINIMGDFSGLLFISFLTSVIALFNKQSRALGIWGLSISLYCLVFIFGIFILGWSAVPFP